MMRRQTTAWVTVAATAVCLWAVAASAQQEPVAVVTKTTKPASSKPPPACGAVYQTLKDTSGCPYESDYTVVACTKMSGQSASRYKNALNPVSVKTTGAPTVKLNGMPLLGGAYTANFVPTKSKLVYLPAQSDGAYTVSTDDSDASIISLCTTMLKEAGFMLPFGMHATGTTNVLPSGAINTECRTKWGNPDYASMPLSQLKAMADAYYASHPEEEVPAAFRALDAQGLESIQRVDVTYAAEDFAAAEAEVEANGAEVDAGFEEWEGANSNC